jgi:indolepyruvate ferredoxin oxidoreductase
MAELAEVSLDDKYTLESGRVFITGTQALVRLPLMQKARDEAAGLNTGCFISGYRGSPLGGFDQQLWRARKFLEGKNIHFQPGVNEDLAATAIWGTQQVGLYPGPTVDGVYSIWYGKGPGVDRSGDVLRHANLAGTAKHGGVLALAGDDHTCKSSTTAHQTEYAFMDSMIPVLHPSNVQEFLDMGLHGWAMSRYAGVWVAFKTLADTVDTSASVHVDPHRVETLIPEDFELPPGGLNIRATTHEPLAEEEVLHRHRLYAALAYARRNKLNREVFGGGNRRLGIVTTGKSYLDVMQAFEDLHIDREFAEKLGIVVYKVGMPWPLEREGIREFAEGLEEILVVEEKRAVIENQVKEQLYNWRPDVRPRVVGKFRADGELQLPSFGELTPAMIARVLVERLGWLPGGSALVDSNEHFKNRLGFLEAKEKSLAETKGGTKRVPYFCSGCPHNTSTKVPEGSRALAGIGCHYMALWMDRNTQSFSQMGGEGMTWLGQAPFTTENHVFANLGDGTYFHSGLLAIRAAAASGVNITYKILFNDAVAMTGGQPHDGPIDVPTIAAQVAAEKVTRLAIVSDEPEKYPTTGAFPPGTTVHHRDELPGLQKEFRETPGCTVIIYDQTCAAEKRRRRKRGLYPDPAKRAFINEAVCEGCGDCSVKSNCLSVVPKETEFGRKREIDQSSCNKDYSCVNGFCPSFVTIEGGKLRKGKGAAAGAAKQAGVADVFEALPDPKIPEIGEVPWDILLTGVGGTGVVTVGALLGMAAHLEGKGVSILDMAGLAQKGGPVTSHIRIAKKPEDIKAVRIAAGGADVILGCDIVVASGQDAMAKAERGTTKAVVNTHESITGDFTRNPDWKFPAAEMETIIKDQVGPDAATFLPGTRIAEALMGDSIATNPFMLGAAFQMGLIPLSADSIDKAMELNGVAVEANRRAFLWGRRAAHDQAAVMKIVGKAAEAKGPIKPEIATTLQDIVAKRIDFLKAYQNDALARRYKDLVDRVVTAESRVSHGDDLARAVARYYFKLLAVKDEYEVARLYTNGDFLKSVNERFEGDFKIKFHLAPPLIAARDQETGELKKREYGPWMMRAFGLLAKLKGLRGTPLDVFGYTDERKMERRLITEYETVLAEVLEKLDRGNLETAVELASVPERIRGYGHVKERHVKLAKQQEAELLARFRDPTPAPAQAAE